MKNIKGFARFIITHCLFHSADDSHQMNKKEKEKTHFMNRCFTLSASCCLFLFVFFSFPISTVTGVDNIASEDVASSDNYTGEWKHELLKA